MLRRLFLGLTKRTPTVTVKRAMTTQTRYLQNELPDFKESTPDASPQQSTLEKQIFDYVSEIKRNFRPSERNGKDGLYLGTGGVAYMFYHLSKIPALSHHRAKFLKDAVDYLSPALKVCSYEVNDNDVPAFLLGNCGVYAVASVIYHALGNESESLLYKNMYNRAARICKDLHFLPSGSDELFVGRAGYICGALWMCKETGTPFKTEDIYDLCRIMITSGRGYAESTKCGVPLMYSYYEVEYLGAGHGICTILQMLMSVPGYLDANPSEAKAVKASVDYVLSLQDKEGNFPAATDEVGSTTNDLVHWCHGAGGMVYLMAKAYLIWNEERYLTSCKKCADLIWEKGLLKKGPGLCHGVAGNAYVFLLLFRLTAEQKYLHRAMQFAIFLGSDQFKEGTRTPDNPYSLFEGVSGTACFLGDLLNPETAVFPFSDVF